MSVTTFRYSPIDSEYFGCIVKSKVVRLSKSDDGEQTLIWLDNGECLVSDDSMNTLEAMLNSQD
jgi:hypothetical protein